MLKKNDIRKELVAWVLAKRTSLTQALISERFGMGNRANVSRAILHIDRSNENEVRKWKREIEKMHGCLH